MPESPIDALMEAASHIARCLQASATEKPNLKAALQISVNAGLKAASIVRDGQTIAFAGDISAFDDEALDPHTTEFRSLPLRHRLLLCGASRHTEGWKRFADTLCALLGLAIVSDHRVVRAQQDYRFLIERAPYAVAVHRDWTVTHANGLWLQMTAGAGAGQTLLDWVHRGDREEANTVLSRGDQDYVEVRAARDPGTWFELSATTGIRFDGRKASMVVGRDVTSRRELQEQVLVYDRMATIGLMAAGVAHEINNPLAAVIANLEMAQHRLEELASVAGPDAHELIEVVEDSAEAAARMRDIVRDLRVFSRGPEATVEPLDVRRVMDTSVRMAANALRHHATVVRHYAEVPVILGSPSRVGQVFLNLLVNAAQALLPEHADTNRVDVYIRAEGSEVVVELADNGPGIPPELLPQMFRPFITTKSRNEGTGLGLAICQRIVTDLGGRIEVSSQPGEGATFTIHFPASVLAMPKVDDAAPRSERPRRRARVLMIDDEELVGRAVTRILSPDHDVEHYTRAAAALERISEDPEWDLILLDLVMPGMSGSAAFDALSRLSPELAKRVVVVTGGIFTERDRRFLERSPCPTLEKPFDSQTLRDLLDELLSMPSSSHLG